MARVAAAPVLRLDVSAEVSSLLSLQFPVTAMLKGVRASGHFCPGKQLCRFMSQDGWGSCL